MSAEQTKSLMEKPVDLEKQLQSLTDRGGALDAPGRSIISDQPPPIHEQTALQIEVSRSSPFAPQMSDCRLPIRSPFYDSNGQITSGAALGCRGAGVDVVELADEIFQGAAAID